MNDRDRKLYENAILGILRLKRRRLPDDLETLREMHALQRKLEKELGVYGVALDDVYNADEDWEPEYK